MGSSWFINDKFINDAESARRQDLRSTLLSLTGVLLKTEERKPMFRSVCLN